MQKTPTVGATIAPHLVARVVDAVDAMLWAVLFDNGVPPDCRRRAKESLHHSPNHAQRVVEAILRDVRWQRGCGDGELAGMAREYFVAGVASPAVVTKEIDAGAGFGIRKEIHNQPSKNRIMA